MRTNTTICARLLAYVTGLVNQELLLQNDYLAAENRILKTRATLAEIGRRLGRKGLQPVARLAKPDTILAWYRQLGLQGVERQVFYVSFRPRKL